MKRFAFAVGAVLSILAVNAHAATYTVTETTDDGGGGTVGSLSWAITQSNASGAVDDTIAFNLSSGSTVTISAALPAVTDSVTIDGNDGGTPVTVKVTTPGAGGTAARVFNVNAFGETVTISNMTVNGGDISALAGAERLGGGIYLAAGTLNLDAVTVSGAKAVFGGGIYTSGALTISNSSIANNVASDYGGGICESGAGSSLTFNNSVISGNSASQGGGFYPFGGTVTFSNGTISGNSAGFGGGIANSSTTTTLSNCTVSGNSGGGIHCFSGTMTIRNSLIVQNTGGNGDYYYQTGTLNDGGYNVVENQSGTSTGAGKTFTGATNILYNTKADGTTGYNHWNINSVDIDGSLNLSATLADNGGPTKTLAFTGASFAAASATTGIPYGSNPYWNNSPSSDQRGVARTASQNTSVGAFSANYVPLPTQVTLTGSPTVLKDSLGKFTLTSVDGSSNPMNVNQDTTFNLTSNSSGTKAFYGDAAGTTTITQTTISNGTSSTSFYYRDDAYGTPTLTATRASGMAIGDANKQIRVSGNNALSFDGTNDYVFFTSPPPYSSNLTIEAWIKSTSTANEKDIVSWGNTSNNDMLEFRMDGGKIQYGMDVTAEGGWTSLKGNISINTGAWTHVAVTKNGTAIKLYVNGVEDVSGVINRNPTFNRMCLGTAYKNGSLMAGHYFPGQIDEVRIWSDVRTEAEIRANMHRQIHPDSANLVAYYKMDTGTGATAYDCTATAYDGTLTNGPTWVTSGAFAGPGNTLAFDGSDDTVNCGTSLRDALVNRNTLTIEAWMNPAALGGGAVGIRNIIGDETNAMSNASSILLRLGDAGLANNAPQLVLNIGGSNTKLNGAATTEIAVGKWCHVAGVYDGSKMRIYVNGVLNAETTASGNVLKGTNAGNLSISTYYNVGDPRVFNGNIDEVRFWKTARTATQIRDDMCVTLNGDEAGLAAYYRMDQQFVAGQTTLYDQTPNGNNGTLTNMDAATDWVASTAFDTWIGSESSTWATAGNWSRAAAPVASDNVGVPDYSNATGFPNGNAPTIAGSPTVNHFVLATNAGSTVSANLTVGGNMLLGNSLNVGANTATVTGTLINTQTLTISTGAVDANGTFDATGGNVTFTDAGNLKLGGATVTSLGTLTTDKGTVWYDRVGNQTVLTDTYNNLRFGGSGTKTLGGVIVVNGILTVDSGVTLDVGGSNHQITCGGSWTNSGTFTARNGTVVFNGVSNQNVTAGGSNFHNLTVNNSGGSVAIQDDLQVAGTLVLTDGAGSLDTNGKVLHAMGAIQNDSGGASINDFDSDHMIVSNGTGGLRRSVSSVGECLFPVGTTSGTAAYSPAALNFTSGTFAGGGYATMSATASKQPSNPSAANYLNRYWTVSQSGLFDFSCSATFQYDASDVAGNDSMIHGGEYVSGSWTVGDSVDAAQHRFEMTVSSFGDFTGVGPKTATVTTQDVTAVTTTTATGNGNVTELGFPSPTQHGVCWSTSANPTTSDSKTESGAVSATGAFTGSITGLTAGTTYHVRAYATNSAGTAYSSDVSFTALKQPIVTTQAVSAITTTSATGNGNVTYLGVPNPTEHGVCWSMSANPTTGNSKTTDGAVSATGAFTSDITGLTPGTTYHVRAYATNSVGTVYGADVSFTALKSPTVTTQAVSSISTMTATGNGNVTYLGVPNPTQHGVCWSTSANPTTTNSKTSDGAVSATGAFTSSVTGLTAGTTYHVRAYATNSAGTVYGSDVSFTTLKAPTVTTQAVSSISTTTATGNGNVTDLGVPNPTQHGVCWATSANPTVADNKTTDGAVSATGAFTSNITGLTPGTTYHVRAYATNAAATVYGSDVTFTALKQPTVTTQAVSSISTTTATGNGNVTDLGVPNPTQHGVCWATTANPTTSSSKTEEGAVSATGAFTSNIIGLTPGTTYHVRAYVTNAAATVYGSDVTFTALKQPTVTTQAVTAITTRSATGNGNVTDLGVPNPTQHGVCWNTSGNPTLADNSNSLGAVSATGSFNGNIFSLSPDTTYYVRAFATNSAGTTYGTQQSFKTLAPNTLNVPGDYASIQQALAAANDDDIVNIAAGTYKETGLSTNKLGLTIQGQGADKTVIDCEHNGRFITIQSDGDVTIKNLSVANGKIDGANGGGILNQGALTLEHVEIRGSQAVDGGGVCNEQFLSVDGCTFAGNTASSQGGGIANFADSSRGSRFIATIVNSTITGNSILAENAQGGGLYNGFAMEIHSCTVVGNGVSGTNSQGGGIYNGGAVCNLKNSLVAGNVASSGPNLKGTIASLDYNLIQDVSGATIEGTTTHNVIGQDPLISQLADNGGGPRTHALKTGSPALNAGDTDLTKDERQIARPQGSQDDIGAFESRFYTVEFAAGANGGLTGTTSQTIPETGDSSAVTAVPDTGYHFTQWNDGNTDNPRQFTNVTSNKSITASFAIDVFKITASAGEGGSITPSGEVSVDYGTSKSFAIAADATYAVADVLVDGTSVGAKSEYVFENVTANHTITATFKRSEVTATLAASPEGAGITEPVVGSHKYDPNGSLMVKAVAANGYYFLQWVGSGAVSLGDPQSAETTATYNTEDFTLSAQFKKVEAKATLTMAVSPVGSGICDPLAGDHEVVLGSTLDVTATAAADYQFLRWTIAGACTISDSSSASAKLTVNGDCQATAVFQKVEAPVTLTLSANPAAAGTVSVLDSKTRSGVEVAPNTPVKIKATAADGWHFKEWMISGTGRLDDAKSPVATATLIGDVALTALFAETVEKATLTLTVSSTEGGSINPGAGTYSVEVGAPFSLKALPSDGYGFKEWKIDGSGTINDPSSPTAILTPSGDVKVTAEFAAVVETVSVTLTVSPSAGGSTNPGVGAFDAAKGMPSSIEAIPAEGYYFVNWTVDQNARIGSSKLAKTTVTVYGETTVTANFANVVEEVSLTLSTAPENSGSLNPGAGTYQVPRGAETNVSASPLDGYEFSHWSITGGGEIADSFSGSTSVALSADAKIKAHFKNSESGATLTLACSPSGGGSLNPGAGTYEVATGEFMTLIAAAETGWHFSRWTIDKNGVVAKPFAATTSVKALGDCAVTAVFEEDAATAILTMNSGDGGFTNPGAGSYEVVPGKLFEIDASPVAGYHFVRWKGSTGVVVAKPKEPSTTVKSTADASVTPVFEANQGEANLTLTIDVSVDAAAVRGAAEESGGSTNPGDDTYAVEVGTRLPIEAIPVSGWHFVQWVLTSGDAEVSDEYSSATTILVKSGASAIALKAVFEKDIGTAELDVASNDASLGTTNCGLGTMTVNVGESLNVVAVPAGGCHFVKWTSEGDVTIVDEYGADTWVKCVSTNPAKITAEFAEDVGTAVLSMATASEDGATSPESGTSMPVNIGEPQKIVAIPNYGYKFNGWTVSGDAVVVDAASEETHVTLSGDATMTANFKYETVTLIMSAGDGGSVDPTVGSHEVVRGGMTAITATAADGHAFYSWSSENATVSVADPFASATTVTLTGDGIVAANFVELEKTGLLTLCASPVAGGEVGPFVGSREIDLNVPISVTAAPTTGYEFAGWTVSGDGTIDEWTSPDAIFSMLGNCVLTAHFMRPDALATLTVSAEPSGGGTVSQIGEVSVARGAVIELTAAPMDGYGFLCWNVVGDCALSSDTDASVKAVISGDAKLTANFAMLADSARLTLQSGTGGCRTFDGTCRVCKGGTTSIATEALPGYVFTNWEVRSGTAEIDNVYSTNAEIMVADDAVVRSCFVRENLIGDAVGQIRMTMNASVANGDYFLIKKCQIDLDAFDPSSDSVEVIIEGNCYEFDADSFRSMRKGRIWIAKSAKGVVPKKRIVIDLKKKRLKCRIAKADFENIDNRNGVGVVFNIGNQTFGFSNILDEKCRRVFDVNSSSAETLPVACDQFDQFRVERSSVKFRNDRSGRDRIAFPMESFALPEGTTFDPEIDDVGLRVDDVVLLIPAGSAWRNTGSLYQYHDRKRGISLRINPKMGLWSVNLRKLSVWSKIDATAALDVYLSVGESESGLRLDQTDVKTWFKYNYNRYCEGWRESEGELKETEGD